MDKLSQIQNRIRGATTAKGIDDNEFIKMHDVLMKEYGWISLEEFKSTPIATVLNLCEAIKLRYEAQEKEMNKHKPRLRR